MRRSALPLPRYVIRIWSKRSVELLLESPRLGAPGWLPGRERNPWH
jgi:hypothetical protein